MASKGRNTFPNQREEYFFETTEKQTKQIVSPLNVIFPGVFFVQVVGREGLLCSIQGIFFLPRRWRSRETKGAVTTTKSAI